MAIKALRKVTSNPYALAKEIHGIGFKTADRIAHDLGIPDDSPVRIDAGIEHLLWDLMNEGHVCYPEKEYIPQAKELLNAEDSAIETRLSHLIEKGDIVREGEMIWVKPLFLAELGIAREIARLYQTPSHLRSVHAQKAITWVEETLTLKLAYQQKEAVVAGVSDKVMIITADQELEKARLPARYWLYLRN